MHLPRLHDFLVLSNESLTTNVKYTVGFTSAASSGPLLILLAVFFKDWFLFCLLLERKYHA